MVQPTSRIVTAGENTILECEAGSNTTLNLTWTKDGLPFTLTTPTVRVENVYSRNLVFTNVEDANNGSYICNATSAEFRRSNASRAAVLTVFSECGGMHAYSLEYSIAAFL